MSTSNNDLSKTAPASKINNEASADATAATDGAVDETVPAAVVTDFITVSSGDFTRADAVGTVTRNGTKIYIKDRHGDYLIVVEFEYEEDAEAEQLEVRAQLTRYEASRKSRVVSRSNRSTKPVMRRR